MISWTAVSCCSRRQVTPRDPLVAGPAHRAGSLLMVDDLTNDVGLPTARDLPVVGVKHQLGLTPHRPRPCARWPVRPLSPTR